MSNEAPGLVLENHYEAPPEFAYSWLTDFHDDDGTRYFGMKTPGTITRNGESIQLEATMDLGMTRMNVSLAPPDRWTAEGGFFTKSGRQMARTRIVESVRPDGPGTQHRAEFYVWPNGFMARLMFLFGGGRMRSEMRGSFDRLKADLDTEYRSVRQ